MCTSYTVTAYANGPVRWVGDSNVAPTGLRTGRISQGQIQLLERELDDRLLRVRENGTKKTKLWGEDSTRQTRSP